MQWRAGQCVRTCACVSVRVRVRVRVRACVRAMQGHHHHQDRCPGAGLRIAACLDASAGRLCLDPLVEPHRIGVGVRIVCRSRRASVPGLVGRTG